MSVADGYVDLKNPIESPTVSVSVLDDDKKIETMLKELLDMISVEQNHFACITEIRKDIGRLVGDYTNSVSMVLNMVSLVCIFILLLK